LPGRYCHDERTPSDECLFSYAEIPLVSEDDVIEALDTDDCAGVREAAGDSEIIL
jgi:hypothetical protein